MTRTGWKRNKYRTWARNRWLDGLKKHSLPEPALEAHQLFTVAFNMGWHARAQYLRQVLQRSKKVCLRCNGSGMVKIREGSLAEAEIMCDLCKGTGLPAEVSTGNQTISFDEAFGPTLLPLLGVPAQKER